ncbi:hypothetical protein L9F63_022691, partial [Diploptera punctata]
NLFFRTSCLLLLGVQPIFILEGKAPELKHNVMSQRIQQRSKNKRSDTPSEEENDIQSLNLKNNGNKGSRSRFNSLLKQCEELLNIMGVPCIQSAGEAEALCAQLNESGLVDGCITQDGDCFLYGARTVFRNFTISHQGTTGYSVEVYNMSVIEQKLSLSRQKLIALSLLCGCDYNDKGVLGVGKETALKFLEQLKDDEVLERLKQWRIDPNYEKLENEYVSLANTCNNCSHSGKLHQHKKTGCLICGLSKGCIQDTQKCHLIQKDPEEKKHIFTELSMRRKALQDETFPSEAMINEFLQKQPLPNFNLSWKLPDITKFFRYSINLLCWTESYAVEKFVPLVTRWQLVHLKNCKGKQDTSSLPFCPDVIIKKRIQRSVQCFELKWKDSHQVLCNVEHSEKMLTTIEPHELVRLAYPDLVQQYIESTAKTKKGKYPTKVVRRPLQIIFSKHRNCSLEENVYETNERYKLKDSCIEGEVPNQSTSSQSSVVSCYIEATHCGFSLTCLSTKNKVNLLRNLKQINEMLNLVFVNIKLMKKTRNVVTFVHFSNQKQIKKKEM